MQEIIKVRVEEIANLAGNFFEDDRKKIKIPPKMKTVVDGYTSYKNDSNSDFSDRAKCDKIQLPKHEEINIYAQEFYEKGHTIPRQFFGKLNYKHEAWFMDRAINKYGINPTAKFLYRGIRGEGDANFIRGLQVGEEFKSYKFVSTSYSPIAAINFCLQGIMFRINTKGIQGITAGSELEFIAHPLTKFKIVDISQESWTFDPNESHDMTVYTLMVVNY